MSVHLRGLRFWSAGMRLTQVIPSYMVRDISMEEMSSQRGEGISFWWTNLGGQNIPEERENVNKGLN